MLISHTKKFIYIKAVKVAGTTVQVALANGCNGVRDIITPVDHPPEETPGYIPKNYKEDKRIIFSSHDYPEKIKNQIGDSIWCTYKKIVVIRNPWEIVVSKYKASYTKDEQFLIKYPTFDSWIEKTITSFSNKSNNFYFWPNGSLTCDTYIRYENIELDMQKLYLELDMPYIILPRLKVSNNKQHYSDFISDKTANIIAQKFSKQIEVFGYQFQRERYL